MYNYKISASLTKFYYFFEKSQICIFYIFRRSKKCALFSMLQYLGEQLYHLDEILQHKPTTHWTPGHWSPPSLSPQFHFATWAMSMLAHCSPCLPFTMPATHRSNHSSCSHLSHAHYSPCSPHMKLAHNSPSLHPTVLTTHHAHHSPITMPFTHHAHHTHHPQS